MDQNVHRPTVAVIGASRNPLKFGHRSVLAHLRHGYEVYPINPTAESVAGIRAYHSLADVPAETIDRVTIYVPPDIGIGLLPDIRAKHPREVWFNPGSDSDAVLARAEELGLPVIAACSLIDLEVSSGTDPSPGKHPH